MKEINLDIRLQPKQLQLLDMCESSGAHILGYGGARGGGKSGAARRIMMLRRLKYPGTTGIIFRRVYDDLKKNHIDKFFEEFPQFFPYWHATDHELILPAVNGRAPSRLVFMYAETETEVKRKFHGPEFMDMFIDQAEQLVETELTMMQTANRWPGVPGANCKTIYFFNPGGKGIAYLKRIFRTKEYHDRERPEDYDFIQAYGWDNVELSRPPLIEDGLTEEDFYSWEDSVRFEYFINRSEYGQKLNRLPEAMRIGHLLGNLDTFAGQFFDIWDESKQTERLAIEDWYPRWMSIDWGFAHNSAVQWHTQTPVKTHTYRELVRSGLGPRALAQEIIDRSHMTSGAQEKIDAVYLSPDAFAKRTNEDTIAQQIGDVLVAAGFPRPRSADDDRVGGWMLMYEMLRYGTWTISPVCEELISNIPLFSRDEKKLEDAVKFTGDDPGDAARYGLKSRFGTREAPKEIQLAAKMQEVSILHAADLSNTHTAQHIAHLKFEHDWRRKHRPARLGRRAWRQN